jgi:hypothetical protein
MAGEGWSFKEGAEKLSGKRRSEIAEKAALAGCGKQVIHSGVG